jgi:PAS domain S-box-containing protein
MAEEIGRREAERNHAIEALQVGEARLRRAQEAGKIGDWEWDLASGRTACSPSLHGLLGLEPGQETVPVKALLERIHPRDRARVVAEVRAAIADKHALDTEFRIVRPDGVVRWLASRGEIERGADGRAVRLVGVGIDVTLRRQGEERQRLLLAELNHRVKNALAIVQVIVRRSLADERVPPETRRALAERLRALAKTHDLLTASAWHGASLRAIAEAELHPYGKRAEIASNDIVLAPRAAQTLGLILHELATNAAKHGALSVPEGRVAVTWGVEPGPGGGRFRLDWRERDGPTVRPPARQGFGRTLIERAIAYELKGEARLDFHPEGLVYAIEAPRAEIAA